MSSSVAVHACLSFSLSSLFLSFSLASLIVCPTGHSCRSAQLFGNQVTVFLFFFSAAFVLFSTVVATALQQAIHARLLGISSFDSGISFSLSHRQRIPVLQVSVDGCSCSGRCRSGGAGAGGGVCLSVCVRLCRCVCVPAVAVSREPATATATQGRTSCRHRLPRLVESCVRVLPM